MNKEIMNGLVVGFIDDQYSVNHEVKTLFNVFNHLAVYCIVYRNDFKLLTVS